MVTPETEALRAQVRELRLAVERDIREVQSARRRLDSTPPRYVVSLSVAFVALLGLVVVLVAGLAGLSSGVLTGIAALALVVTVILGDRAGKRSA